MLSKHSINSIYVIKYPKRRAQLACTYSGTVF